MPGPSESGPNPHRNLVGRRRTRIQSCVYDALKRIPGIEDVRLEESGTGISEQVAASVNTAIFADGVVPCDDATLQVNWWPQPEEDDWFQIHYADGTGFDCAGIGRPTTTSRDSTTSSSARAQTTTTSTTR